MNTGVLNSLMLDGAPSGDASTCALAAASSVASLAFAVDNIPPAVTVALGASASAASAALDALNAPPPVTATLAASASLAAVDLAAGYAPPPQTVAVAPASTVAGLAFAVLAAGGSTDTVELDTAAEDAFASFTVIVAPVANPNLKQAVVAALKASAPIAGIVGTRIYPDAPPATASLPSLSYTYIWAEHVSSLSGPSGMVEYRMRFECRALVQADNEALALYVRMLFQGRPGYVQGVYVLFCTSEHELDKYLPPLPGSDNGTHYKRFDMRFKVRESVPTFS